MTNQENLISNLVKELNGLKLARIRYGSLVGVLSINWASYEDVLKVHVTEQVFKELHSIIAVPIETRFHLGYNIAHRMTLVPGVEVFTLEELSDQALLEFLIAEKEKDMPRDLEPPDSHYKGNPGCPANPDDDDEEITDEEDLQE